MSAPLDRPHSNSIQGVHIVSRSRATSHSMENVDRKKERERETELMGK